MISEITEAEIRPLDHPKVYCASALTNLTVDTGVASASRPLVCFIDIDVVINMYPNTVVYRCRAPFVTQGDVCVCVCSRDKKIKLSSGFTAPGSYNVKIKFLGCELRAFKTFCIYAKLEVKLYIF